jgi:hypothetical protein
MRPIFRAWNKVDLTHYIAVTYFKLKEKSTVSELHQSSFRKQVPIRARKERGQGKAPSA